MDATPSRRQYLLGILFAAIGATCWGFSGTCSQFLFEGYEIDAFFIITARTALSALCFLSVILISKRDAALSLLRGTASSGHASTASMRKRVLLRLFAFGVALYASQLFYVLTISLTNSGTATVIMMLYLIFVMLYTTAKTRSAPSMRELAGLVLAIAGTIVIATQGDIRTLDLPPEGIVFGIICAMGCAGYIVVPKPLLQGNPSFVVTGLGMLADAVIAFIGWLAFCAITGHVDIPQLDVAGWVALILGMGVVGTFGAFWMFMKGVAMVGTITGSLVGALEPISAMLVSMVWLSTPFTIYDWIGLVAMIAMLVLVTLGPRKGPGESR